MAVLDLVVAPNPILKKKATIVEKIDDKIRDLLKDMVDTMYNEEGIGLAAPQIGVSKRIFVLDLQDRNDNEDIKYPLNIINPEIIATSEEKVPADEGCLSLPGHYISVIRPKKVTLSYLDELGDKKTIEADGLLARAIQHELDHIDGKLLIDYVSHLKRNVVLKKLQKLKAS